MDSKWQEERARELERLWESDPDRVLALLAELVPILPTENPRIDALDVIQQIVQAESAQD